MGCPEKVLAWCVGLVMLSGFLALIVLDRPSAEWLCLEDHLVENLGAAGLLFAFLFSFDSARRKWQERRTGAFRILPLLFFLALAALYFFGFGEEISWGQRIFNDATPQWLDRINEQHETNVHNITISFLGVGLHVWIKWMFYAFLLGYLVLLPLARSFRRNSAAWLERSGIPVVPVWLAVFVLINFLVHSTFQGRFAHGAVNWPLDEMCETFWEVLLGVSAFLFWRGVRNRGAIPAARPSTGLAGSTVEERTPFRVEEMI